MPAGFRVDPDTDELRCPHRDLSCCPDCERTHPEVVEAMGRHYWVPDPADRVHLRAMDAHLAAGADSPTGNPLICAACGGEILPGAMVVFVGPDADQLEEQRIFTDDELLVAHEQCPDGSRPDG